VVNFLTLDLSLRLNQVGLDCFYVSRLDRR